MKSLNKSTFTCKPNNYNLAQSLIFNETKYHARSCNLEKKNCPVNYSYISINEMENGVTITDMNALMFLLLKVEHGSLKRNHEHEIKLATLDGA